MSRIGAAATGVRSSASPKIRSSEMGSLQRYAGVSFCFLAAQFMTMIMVTASMAPGYDLSGGAISDLGVHPVTAPLFNTSLVVTGLLNALGGVLLYRINGRILPLTLYALAGAGVVGAGLVTLEAPGIHGLFALAAFLFFNLQIIPEVIRLRGAIGTIGGTLAAIGLAYVVIMAAGDAGNPSVFGAIGHGGAERMIVYPPMLWLMIYGGFLLGRAEARI